MADLPICARLRRKTEYAPHLINPDGPEAADTIAALYEALTELLASCDRGAPAIHDGCGTTIISAPSPQAMRKANAALSLALGEKQA